MLSELNVLILSFLPMFFTSIHWPIHLHSKSTIETFNIEKVHIISGLFRTLCDINTPPGSCDGNPWYPKVQYALRRLLETSDLHVFKQLLDCFLVPTSLACKMHFIVRCAIGNALCWPGRISPTNSWFAISCRWLSLYSSCLTWEEIFSGDVWVKRTAAWKG